jgi:hypothetical protein
MIPCSRLLRRSTSALASLALVALVATGPAHALSEIPPDENAPPAATEGEAPAETNPAPSDERIEKTPLPPPVGTQASPPANASPPDAAPTDGAPAEAEGEEGAEPDLAEPANPPQIDPDAPVPEVIYDLSKLPRPAARMRELILEATKSGDVEKLRPLLGMGDGATTLSLGGVEGDLIDFLRQSSGDGQGQEILAILEEVLEAGFVHLDAGKPEELYVWPYFFAVPLATLTPPQRVELFRIVTAGDYEDMKSFGSYIFYRVGITPEGRWSFFLAGD